MRNNIGASGARAIFKNVGLALVVLAGWTDVSAQLTAIRIDEKKLVIEGDTGGFETSWDFSRPEPDLLLATLTLAAPQPAKPPALKVLWDFPAVNLAGTWVSDNTKANNDHQRMRIDSRAVLRAPLLMYLGPDDSNRMTISASDTLRPLTISGGVKEEDIRIHGSIDLFAGKEPPLKEYRITLRFDSRPLPFHQVLKQTARWWGAQDGYQPAPVPETARVPLYSTWYAYHQNLDPDKIVEECRIGGELGLGGVIVDDGWQTLDGNRGYAFTGDWKPERIPDFKGFVDRVHALGQKFIMWYSVPMAGGKSEAAKRFKGKTLGFSEGLGAHILDPRYPEVREYLISLYEGAVRDWGVDGLKLDFIELFAPNADTVLTAENGRDFASVDEAVDRLFSDIMTRLRAIKPDVAIEFRQPYNGPLMRKYGNMLRGVDCPNAGPVNRKEIVDLRLLADQTAVHSDMFIWHPEEPLESAALQILNVIFSVPQVSVRLTEIPPAHRGMIGFWMKYWRKNREVLLDGEFIPVSPAQNYPMVSGRNEQKWISVIYQDMVVAPEGADFREIDIINAKAGGNVVLRLDKAFGTAEVTVRDCSGSAVSSETMELAAGASMFEVPASGLLEIRQRGGR
jgi:alpha-galactosidase